MPPKSPMNWMKGRAAAVAALAVICAGCDVTTPSTSTTVTPTVACPETTPTSVLVTGTIGIGETSFYSFSPTCSTSVRVLLGSLTPAGSNTPSATPIGIGLGVPLGTGCGLTNSMVASTALTAQLVSPVAPGTYCIAVYDTGNVKAPLDYALRLVY